MSNNCENCMGDCISVHKDQRRIRNNGFVYRVSTSGLYITFWLLEVGGDTVASNKDQHFHVFYLGGY